MSDLSLSSSTMLASSVKRRESLAAHALRAGCGTLTVQNSMQELLAMVCIGSHRSQPDASAEATPSSLTENNTPAQFSPLNQDSQGKLFTSILRTKGLVVNEQS